MNSVSIKREGWWSISSLSAGIKSQNEWDLLKVILK